MTLKGFCLVRTWACSDDHGSKVAISIAFIKGIGHDSKVAISVAFAQRSD